MKRIENYSYLVLVFLLISCQNTSKEFIRHQTFDEYKLKGINTHSGIKSPYVFIKTGLDTITVIKSNDKKRTKQYLKRKDYWYTETEKDVYNKVSEKKFIFNDTLLYYSYLPMPGSRSGTTGECVILETKEKRIIVFNNPIIYNSEFELFNSLKEAISTYKNLLLENDTLTEYHLKNKYRILTKKFKDNNLYLYNYIGKDLDHELFDAYRMNSLEEYDLENAKNILNQVQ